MEKNYSAYADQHPCYETLGTPREVDIIRFHADYNIVTSDYLYHFLGKRQSVRDYLTDLRKGTYIGFPHLSRQEKLAYIPRNGFYATELKPRGKKLAESHGIAPRARDNDHILHKIRKRDFPRTLTPAILTDGLRIGAASGPFRPWRFWGS